IYMHSDGSVLNTCEYWPTRELAQAVLDKYQPAHVWVHGDVFDDGNGQWPKIYIHIMGEKPQVFRLCGPIGENGMPTLSMVKSYTNCPGVTFLFNIKDKLPC
ncbi:hypothetical protein LCGC14_3054590, partial [marine sediment metagenome]